MSYKTMIPKLGLTAGTSIGSKRATTIIFFNLIIIISNSVISASSASAPASAFVSTRIQSSPSFLPASSTKKSSSLLEGKRIVKKSPILLSSIDDDDIDAPLDELETMCMMNMANLCSSSEEECSTETKQDLIQKLELEKHILDIRLFRFGRLIRGLKMNNNDNNYDDDDDDYNHYDYGPIPVPVYDLELMCLLNNAKLCIDGNATTDSTRIEMMDEIKYHKNILSYRVFKMNELINKLSETDHQSIDIISLLDEIDDAIKIETMEKELEVDSFLHVIEDSLFAETEEDVESLLSEISNGLFGSTTNAEKSRNAELISFKKC